MRGNEQAALAIVDAVRRLQAALDLAGLPPAVALAVANKADFEAVMQPLLCYRVTPPDPTQTSGTKLLGMEIVQAARAGQGEAK